MARGRKIALSWALALAGVAAPHAIAREAEFVRALETRESAGQLERETYPNGSVKLERHVARNPEGRMVLHGAWSMHAEDGRFLGGGEYVNDQRQGKWLRMFTADEAEMLKGAAELGFVAPFESETTFEGGEIHGTWRVVDAQRREILSFSYDHGRRDGLSVWRLPNGQAYREITFAQDVVDGEIVERDEQNRIVAREVYDLGRRQGATVERYPSGKKKSEAHTLFAKEIVEHTDHWWNGMSRQRVVSVEGGDERHGPHTVWFENGRIAQQGTFEHDAPTGRFAWFYADGVQAIEGFYRDGEQSGDWAWWYPTGAVRIRGHFAVGKQIGAWTWWNEEGRVQQTALFKDESNATLATATTTLPQREPLPPAPPLEDEEDRPSQARPIRNRTIFNHR